MRRPMQRLLLAALASTAVAAPFLIPACASNGSGDALLGDQEPRFGPGRVTPSGIQSELMGFTNTYIGIVTQPLDELTFEQTDAALRLRASAIKSDWVQNALAIATGANPVAGLLDMTVMVTLQRMSWERTWMPRFWGAAGEPVAEALRSMEREVWRIAERALEPAQRDAMTALVEQMCVDLEGRLNVSSIRASEFAEDRQRTFVSVRGGGSLLTLFALDPLANLNPTTREIAESRLLAERVFFYARHAPTLLGWQLQLSALGAAALPETQQTVDTLGTTGAALDRGVDTVDRFLTTGLPAEREAALDQALDGIAAERTEAVDQVFDRLAAEREAIVETLRAEDAALRGTLVEVKQTLDAGAAFSDSARGMFVAFDGVVARFQSPPETRGTDPAAVRGDFDILAWRDALDSAAEAAREISRLVEGVDGLAGSAAGPDREAAVRTLADGAVRPLEALVDRIYRRALMLLLVLLGGVMAIVVVSRLLGRGERRRHTT